MELVSELFSTYFRPVVLSTVILLIIYRRSRSDGNRKKKMPPGPPNLPVLGSLPFLGKDIREPLRKMAKKYGELMTVHLGARETVYLNNYDVIKEAFVKNGHLFSGRPQDLFYMKELCNCSGIISAEGDLWREQRRFTHTVLKDLGMGRGILEPKILEEVQSYLSVISEWKERPTDPHYMTMKAIANVIYSIVNGKRSDYADAHFNRYVEDLNWSFEALGDSGIAMALPFIKNIPGDFFSFRKLFAILEYHDGVYMDNIRAHRDSHDPENPRDFMDIYITQMLQDQSVNPNSTFSNSQLLRVVADLFGAGTETTSNTILWTFAYLLNNPAAMRRCQSEIDDVIGRERAPSMKDKVALPYVEATIWEVHRMASVVPFGVPHTNVEDMEFHGHFFPKGTNFMPNLYAINYDDVIWREPRKFRPERHLSDDGKLLKADELIPFSIGRRVCVGESLAKMELFLFITSLLQKFDLVLPAGAPCPSLRGKLGATHIPPHFEVIFKPRL